MATPEEELQEALSDLQESLKHAIHYFTAILDEITAGSYTPDKAMQDYESLMWTEGIDFMSAIQSVAEVNVEMV